MHRLSALLLALGSLSLADTTADNFNPLHHLAGISPYFSPNDPALDASPPQGCNVTRAAYLVRHAAIYANDFDYESYIEPFVEKLRNTTQDWSKAGSLSFLGMWNAPITDAHIEKITRVGLQEAMMLGIDIHDKYPDFKTPDQIWSSTAERTVKTAQEFIVGFTGDQPKQINLTEVGEYKKTGADSLTPYKSCPAYSSSYGSDQSKEFVSRYTKPIIARLQAQAPSFNFTADDIVSMFELCGYETVIRGSSPFCSLDLFTANEWLAFEYGNDIMYFHNTGYGRELSPRLGFPWVNATQQILADDTVAQDLYVSFTHRELPPTVLTALGLFNNSAFTGAYDVNATMPTDTINYGRAWRSSQILPFLTNIAIEKMACDSLGYDEGNYYRVLLNEDPQPLVGCRDGPGETCSERAFADFVRQRGAMYGDFSTACGVDYENSTDVLSIYQS
ncbi:putative histidine acid phosphatase [Aspergillus clavatus NRRL 1]|uniref:Histidine acid phosphatase, putative n=1 Tax=Aspergillus clavatus (strain ATCC 1007 / CBS 513.65 / DSM 816 / NCTC 3887 / NRRL 1 / QM 1276 / 107) TaxID=344612 RepID=A1C8N8_ASPCL|nr:histidine acid phosphatase, putative [Aspergillus clavatus NRRL 1]EAW13675.1 histidine acid phosphatase, putative [Aspergillus clavatus NRRL 1]